jgi:hypothetical protein
MLFQLPNGKTVYLTVEEYLDLTDIDIQYLMSINYGESIQNPWHGSSISKSTPKDKISDDLDYQDDEISDNFVEFNEFNHGITSDDYDLDIDFDNEDLD